MFSAETVMRMDRDPPPPPNGRAEPSQGFTKDGSACDATEDIEQCEQTTVDELQRLLRQLRELGEYFSYFVSAKTDDVKLSLRHAVLWGVSAAVGFVVVGGLIVIASWLLLSGLAEGLGELFGGRAWAGSLATGLLSSACLGLGMYYALATGNRIARDRTAHKYEKRQARQQAEFGRHVADHAAASAAGKE